MNYFKLIQKYLLILFFSLLTFQSSFSQTISPPFQQVPAVPPSGSSGSVFFDINATGDWILTSTNSNVGGRGNGNDVFRFDYGLNDTPDERIYTFNLYDPAISQGSVSSVTVTPNIITFPPNATPQDVLQANPYFFGDPLYPSYIYAIFQQVSGNDYEIIVDISDAGLGYTEAQYPIRLKGGGSNASITPANGGGNTAVFRTDANGELAWNTVVPSKTLDMTNGASPNGEVQYNSGSGYFAPPNIVLLGWSSSLPTPVFETQVTNGNVTSVTILPIGGFTPNTEYTCTVNIVPSFTVDVAAVVNINNPSTNLTPVSSAVVSQLGNVDYYSVSGKVFRDWNGNQVQDTGEEGIAGVNILNSNSFPNSWVFTESEGNYRLNFLRAFGNTVTFSPQITEATPINRTVTLSNTNPSVTGQDFAIGATGGRVGGIIVSQDGERVLPNQDYKYQILLDNSTNSSQTIAASFTPDSRFEIVSSSVDFDGNIPATFSVDVPAYSSQTIDIVLKASESESLTNGEYIRHYLEINSSTGRYNEQAQITQQIDENAVSQSINLSLLSTPSLTQEEISSDKTFTYHIYKGNNAPAETAYTEMVIYLNEDADMSKLDILESSLEFSNVEVSSSKTIRLKLNSNPSETAPLSFLFNLISEQTDLRVYALLNYYNGFGNLISSDISSIITTKVDANPAPQQLIGIFKAAEGNALSWVANDGFSNFVISRKSENETEFKEVGQIGGAERNWLDTQVSPTTTYTYKVLGKKDAASSNFSNEVTIKTDETITAIDEKQSSRITLYPNPSQNSIHFKGTELLSISHIEVVDLLGNRIIKATNSSNLDISNLKNGMYIVRFVSQKGVFTKTFCKM
ncbi:T9SS type A sorting domain-containing protein [Bernardetia sp. MNP-M8]|uniref:T9SS type A sorting domain-containing protein n=1 Tax=Bernardetia sp. MNP-M8 TaxID=3127470 RepID=UPI0030CB406B